MCLGKINTVATQKLRQQNKWITCYKLVYKQKFDIYPIYHDQHTCYNIGLNTSNRKSRKILKYEFTKNIISRGFHVFATKLAAQKFHDIFDADPTFIIIKVKCHTKNLVAHGYYPIYNYNKKLYYKSMVFTKMIIPDEQL